MYSCICFLFLPTVSTKYPLAQKCRSPYLYFRFACLSNIIRLLFPLRYPMICDGNIRSALLRCRLSFPFETFMSLSLFQPVIADVFACALTFQFAGCHQLMHCGRRTAERKFPSQILQYKKCRWRLRMEQITRRHFLYRKPTKSCCGSPKRRTTATR